MESKDKTISDFTIFKTDKETYESSGSDSVINITFMYDGEVKPSEDGLVNETDWPRQEVFFLNFDGKSDQIITDSVVGFINDNFDKNPIHNDILINFILIRNDHINSRSFTAFLRPEYWKWYN